MYYFVAERHFSLTPVFSLMQQMLTENPCCVKNGTTYREIHATMKKKSSVDSPSVSKKLLLITEEFHRLLKGLIEQN